MKNRSLKFKPTDDGAKPKTYTIADFQSRNNFLHMETQETASFLYPEALKNAHSHDFFLVAWFMEGRGRMIADFETF